MKNNIFLLDANAFLTPSKYYYRFSIAPNYWKQINDLAKDGFIKTIDKINKEVCPRENDSEKDDIQLWFENDFKGEVIRTHKQNIVDEYVKVIEHLHSSEKYSEKAFLEWSSREDIADPWLIATAKTFGYTIISFEVQKHYSGHPLASPKIPNICQDLNVNYISLYNMMEQLGVKL